MPPNADNSLCSRCLVILNATTSVIDLTSDEACPNPSSMLRLRRWVEEHMWGEGHRIAVDGVPDMFEVIGTWHGDGVCWWHLTECRKAEMR